MTAGAARQNRVLLIGLKSRTCAFPLGQVIETMRPLPVEALADAPPFVKGVAIIRGVPTPVVDLGVVLGAPGESPQRFVTIRSGQRQVALSVNAVLGVHDLDSTTALGELPPLLQNASQEFVAMIGTLDEKLLWVLRSGWELPDKVWRAMTVEEKAS